MPHSVKLYYCPLCKNEQREQTGHEGEIYVACENCKSTPLYCGEPFARSRFTHLSSIQVVFHYYYLNISEEVGIAVYRHLGDHLKSLSYKLFNVLPPAFGSEHKYWKEYNGKTITLYTPDQWEGQYVSDIGRVHDWKEFIFPNKAIKCGYWLERIKDDR